MTESRIVATERLRREGRWEEASAYRDEVRRELRLQKMPRAEANDAAWNAMLEKYPPKPAQVAEGAASTETSIEEEADDFAAMVDRMQNNPPDLDRDALWAYEHLDVRGARPDAAPSMGAWGLLKWARSNRNRFFEQVLPKAAVSRQMRGQAKVAPMDLVGDDADDMSELERLCAAAKRVQAAVERRQNVVEP